MTITIAFRGVRDPFGWLGNMSPHPLTAPQSAEQHAGIWRTAEAYFQACRFDNREIIEEIRRQRSPMQAKFVAKANLDKMVVQPRSSGDVDLMHAVLRLKIRQHPLLQAQLLAIPRDALIIEDVTKRPASESARFWGAALQPGGIWHGQNQLGRLWSAIRAEWS